MTGSGTFCTGGWGGGSVLGPPEEAPVTLAGEGPELAHFTAGDTEAQGSQRFPQIA